MSNMEGTSVETTSTTGASEANPATGSADPGATGGTQPAADTFAAEREQYESRVRSFQSEADRAKAEVASLRAQLESAGNGGGAGSDPAPTAAFDPDTFVSELESRMTHRQTMREAAAALQSEFEFADEDVLKNAHEYESPEALRAVIEEGHTAISSWKSEIEEQARNEAMREFATKYGIQIEAPPPSNTDAPAGEPDVATFASWSFQEQAAYEQKNPGFTQRLLRTANF